MHVALAEATAIIALWRYMEGLLLICGLLSPQVSTIAGLMILKPPFLCDIVTYNKANPIARYCLPAERVKFATTTPERVPSVELDTHRTSQ